MISEYIKYKDVDKIIFPCLMKCVNYDIIVIFTDYSIGTVVYTDNIKYKLGYYSDEWIDCKTNEWIPLKKDEKVTLENS